VKLKRNLLFWGVDKTTKITMINDFCRISKLKERIFLKIYSPNKIALNKKFFSLEIEINSIIFL